MVILVAEGWSRFLYSETECHSATEFKLQSATVSRGPPHRVAFLRRFGLKTGVHFAPFGLESGMVFEGTTEVHERIYRFNSVWVRKKEKYANRNEFEQFQVSRSNPSNDNIISV